MVKTKMSENVFGIRRTERQCRTTGCTIRGICRSIQIKVVRKQRSVENKRLLIRTADFSVLFACLQRSQREYPQSEYCDRIAKSSQKELCTKVLIGFIRKRKTYSVISIRSRAVNESYRE